jgi:hypothetical protein
MNSWYVSSSGRAIGVLAALVIAAGVVASLEARSVWSYVVWPPSLENERRAWTRIVAISQVNFTPGALQHMTKQEMVQRATMCEQLLSRCGQGAWVLVRALNGGLSDTTPDIAQEIWEPVLEQELKRQQSAEWRAGEWKTVTPAGGIAVQFQSSGQEWLLIEYSSYRGDDNRYAQIEALYRLGPRWAVLAADAHSFFDNERLPQLWFSALFELNSLMLLVGALLVRLARTSLSGTRRFALATAAPLLMVLANYFSYAAIARFDAAFYGIKAAFALGALTNSALPALSLFYIFRNKAQVAATVRSSRSSVGQ